MLSSTVIRSPWNREGNIRKRQNSSEGYSAFESTKHRCYKTPVSQTLSSSASRAVCCACTCSYHICFTSQAEWKGRNAEHVVFVLNCSSYVQSAFSFLCSKIFYIYFCRSSVKFYFYKLSVSNRILISIPKPYLLSCM